MTRKELIEFRAGSTRDGLIANYVPTEQALMYEVGFKEGAKYADKTMLDRAENYLRSKLEYRPILKEEYIHGQDYIRHRQEQSRLCDEFITAFRQAMEGGAE